MKTALTAALALCLANTVSAQETLHIYNWSDYIDPTILFDFTAETGIQVEYDTYTDAETTETQLIIGGSGYDLVVVSSEYLQRLIELQAVRPLELERLTNRHYLMPEIMERIEVHDPGSRHSVPYLWGTTGIGYDVNAVQERMPNAPTDSWAMIFDPEIVSRFSDCGVAIADSPEEVLSIALNYLGHDPNSKAPAEITAAQELIGAIAPHLRIFSSDQMPELSSGDICLTLNWSGDVLFALDEAADDVDLVYAVPHEGAPIWFDMFVVPTDARNGAAAHAFINFILRPEIIARATHEAWYPNPNSAATALVDPEMLSNPAIYPPADVMENLFAVPSRGVKEKRDLARVWRRLKLGF